jgi:hypothetical protein
MLKRAEDGYPFAIILSFNDLVYYAEGSPLALPVIA